MLSNKNSIISDKFLLKKNIILEPTPNTLAYDILGPVITVLSNHRCSKCNSFFTQAWFQGGKFTPKVHNFRQNCIHDKLQ